MQLLELVSLEKNCYFCYPHQLSGGMLQRAALAVALACQPKLLIADEPTTALDATVQAEILRLLARLKRELGMAMLLITHDFGVAAQLADDIAVMYAGKFVEQGRAEEVLYAPGHPYTWSLLAALPGAERALAAEKAPQNPARPSAPHPSARQAISAADTAAPEEQQPESEQESPPHNADAQADHLQAPPRLYLSPTHWAAWQPGVSAPRAYVREGKVVIEEGYFEATDAHV